MQKKNSNWFFYKPKNLGEYIAVLAFLREIGFTINGCKALIGLATEYYSFYPVICIKNDEKSISACTEFAGIYNQSNKINDLEDVFAIFYNPTEIVRLTPDPKNDIVINKNGLTINGVKCNLDIIDKLAEAKRKILAEIR